MIKNAQSAKQGQIAGKVQAAMQKDGYWSNLISIISLIVFR
jgi:hypothetical protein